MNNLLVITPRYPHHLDRVSEFFVFSQIEEIRKYFKKVVVISTTPYSPKCLSIFLSHRRNLDALAENYSYENVDVFFTRNIILPIDALKRMRGDLAYRTSMAILKKINFNPDIIHAHFIWPSGYVAMKISETINVPYLITAHGYDVYLNPFRNTFYYDSSTSALSKAKSIISVSKSNKKILEQKLNVPSSKIVVIPNGYDEKVFYPQNIVESRTSLNLAQDKKILLSVGNLETIKGHRDLISAFKRLSNGNDQYQLIIIGHGSEENKLKELIGNYNNIILVGAKPHNEIPVWMNACDVFTMASLNEGVPTVLFEALACGKPYVGTNVGGIPDIITNDDIGILVRPGDSIALSEALNKALKITWNTKNISLYSMQYTWYKIVKDIMAIYSNILNNKVNSVLKCKEVN